MTRLLFLIIFILIPVGKAYFQTYNILDFGAKSSESFVNTESINKAIKECANKGGGTVLIPKGEYISGTIHLKSNVNLHLETGSFLIGSLDINDYGVMPDGYYYSGKNLMGLIFANDVENISITGEGVLEGRGTFFMKKKYSLCAIKRTKKIYTSKRKISRLYKT